MSTMMSRLLITAAVVACGRSQTAPAGGEHTTLRPEVAGTRRDGPQAPVTVAIDVMKGAPAAGSTIALRAHVSHAPTWSAPLDFEIKLPPGVSLTSGMQHFMLTPSPGQDVDDVDFEIQLPEDIPLADIVVVAAYQSKEAGVRAEGRYRFGRPPPMPLMPDRSGPEIVTNKGSLGRSVPLQPN
jgi:hypothetical protein